MKEFVEPRAKTYTYLIDDNSELKRAKRTKKCVMKRGLVFKNYKDCLFNNKIILKLQQIFKSDHHNVYTEQINKIEQVVIMIRNCKHLIKLHRIHMEQTHAKCAKVRC